MADEDVITDPDDPRLPINQEQQQQASNDFGFVDAAMAPPPVRSEPAPQEDFGFVPFDQQANESQNLERVRSGYAQELQDPKVAGKLYALTDREVGDQNERSRLSFIESVFNRGWSRGMTLAQTLSDASYYPSSTVNRRVAFTPDQVTHYRGLADRALQGSNVSNYATGNASGGVGFAGGPTTAYYGGDRFGTEGPDVANMRQLAGGEIPRARQADVQVTYIEKGQPVTPVELEVRRAKPIGNEFGFVPFEQEKETPTAQTVIEPY